MPFNFFSRRISSSNKVKPARFILNLKKKAIAAETYRLLFKEKGAAEKILTIPGDKIILVLI